MEALRKTVRLFSVVLSARRRGNGHKLKHKEFHLNHTSPPSFSSKVDETLEQVGQSGCRVFILADFQNLTGDNPGQPVLVDPVLRRGDWKNDSQRLLSKFSYSMIV